MIKKPTNSADELAHINDAFDNSVQTTTGSQFERLTNERHMRWMEPTRLADERRDILLKAAQPLLEHLGTAPLPTKYGDWTYVAFGDLTTGAHASALVYGDLNNGAFPTNKPVPVRVHSACSAAELFLANGCGDLDKIESWMKNIHGLGGPGVIVYLDQDGRGNGMQQFLRELGSKFIWNVDGTLDFFSNSGLPKEYDQKEIALKDARDYHSARRIIKFLNIPTPSIISDNEIKRSQLAPDFVEPEITCPDDEVAYYKLKATEIIRDGNSEWKKPWETIEFHKNLLEANNHSIVMKLGQGPLKTSYGDWTLVAYGDYTSGETHLALIYGQLRDALDGNLIYPTRVHSSCQTNEKFHALNCECRAELHETMSRIHKEGRGLILYLQQEGRGNGVYGKMFQLAAMFGWKDGKIVQNISDDGQPVTTVKAYELHKFHGEIRDFTVAGAILHNLGVKKVEHHSNNPRKKYGLEKNGIEVVSEANLHFPDLVRDNPILYHDLKDKQQCLGHKLDGAFDK